MAPSEGGTGAPAGRGRKLKKPTPERLRRRALAYLERFESGRANLRRVLLNRAGREARAFELEQDEVAAWVEAILDDFERAGLIDDRRFAFGRARSLLEQGRSPRVVGQALRRKGVDQDLARATLGALAEDEGLDELRAAAAFARKRRLGPYRRPDAVPLNEDGEEDRGAAFELRRKETGAMARAGFGFEAVRKVLDVESVDELEEALAEER